VEDVRVADHLEHVVTAPDGRTLAVAEWGDPGGQPVIVLHGTPGSRLAHWRDPGIYARHGVRRITYDRAGYGGSTRLAGRTIADVTADVVAIADALGIGRFAVTGGSGGGPHALACGALLGDRVERCLASVCPAPIDAEGLDWTAGMVDGNIREFELSMEGEAALRPVVQRERAEMLARLTAGDEDFLGSDYPVSETDRAQIAKDRAIIAEMFQDGLRNGVDGWVDDDLAMVRPWGFDLDSVTLPLMLRYGRGDTLVPAAHGDWLASRLPHAVVVVSEAGHLGRDEDIDEELAWLAGSAWPA
jgi:pimeloyl-ACP methyl ester carboxylesterase